MRYKSALAAVSLLAASLTLAQPAQAAVPTAVNQATATCSLVLPARISIKADVNYFFGKLGSNCPDTVYTAVWKSSPNATMAPQGKLQFLYGNREAQFVITGTVPHIGKVAWNPAGSATNISGVKVATLNATTSVIRAASTASVIGGRKGTRTALIAAASYWRPNSDRFVAWPNRKVLLQYQEVGSTTWKGLAYVTTDSKGKATYTYFAGKSRKYRAYVAGTSSVWDDFSPLITR
ncbi:hypothetical protein OHA70_06755 [Kribbella sp. NBC_00382]|uniref:hypothetical protein n=1 Tax=Kribbella sp. NBC_00382 TaxID=2975967 RepID=UPI002E1CCE12